MQCVNFYEMIGTYYYKNDKPIGIIEEIIELQGDYKIIVNIGNRFKQIFVDYITLLKVYKEYLLRKERANILIERNINEIVHFTKIENLDSILEYGLLSKNILEEQRINYLYSDNYRYDNKLDFICNSITFPNYKMFYAKRQEDIRQKWAVITIDADILLHKLDTEFYKKNRASLEIYEDDRYYRSNEAFNSMFSLINRDLYIPDSYTTDPQAEVLIKDIIIPDYITGIETNTNNEKVKSLALNVHKNYNPYSTLFNGRCDYRRW